MDIRRYKHETRRNVTLVELVVTISFITIISTLCFPKENISKYQINSFTKQLCSDIRYVRKNNMLGCNDTYIYYKNNNGTHSYILRQESKDVKEISLPKDVQLLYTRGKILFKKDGSPQQLGATIKIISKDIKREITIVPVSGRVLLKEGKYES